MIDGQQTNTTSRIQTILQQTVFALCKLSTQDNESDTLSRKMSNIATGWLGIFGGIHNVSNCCHIYKLKYVFKF